MFLLISCVRLAALSVLTPPTDRSTQLSRAEPVHSPFAVSDHDREARGAILSVGPSGPAPFGNRSGDESIVLVIEEEQDFIVVGLLRQGRGGRLGGNRRWRRLALSGNQ